MMTAMVVVVVANSLITPIPLIIPLSLIKSCIEHTLYALNYSKSFVVVIIMNRFYRCRNGKVRLLWLYIGSKLSWYEHLYCFHLWFEKQPEQKTRLQAAMVPIGIRRCYRAVCAIRTHLATGYCFVQQVRVPSSLSDALACRSSAKWNRSLEVHWNLSQRPS